MGVQDSHRRRRLLVVGLEQTICVRILRLSITWWHLLPLGFLLFRWAASVYGKKCSWALAASFLQRGKVSCGACIGGACTELTMRPRDLIIIIVVVRLWLGWK